MINLPEKFEEFSEARQNGFIEVKKLKEEGKKVVGVYCAFTPQEMIRAGGLIPVSLCGVSEEPIVEAEKELPRNLCPLIKSSYGHAVTDTCPYFYFSDFLIGETTCDGKKKMYELLGRIKPTHVMNLPNNPTKKTSFELWRSEIVKLKEELEDFFNIKITEKDMSEAIKTANAEKRALKAYYELGKMMPPPVWGRDIYKVLNGAEYTIDSDELIRSLTDMREKILEDYEKGCRPVPEEAPRILITGCPIGGVTGKVLDVIEASGAVVVAFENCGALRTTEGVIDETMDPVEAMTQHSLNIGCACMSPNHKRLEMLDRIIDEYHIDGVVDVVLQACHTFNVETARISRLVREKKEKSYLKIETDYSKSDADQIRIRLEAFIEMIKE